MTLKVGLTDNQYIRLS